QAEDGIRDRNVTGVQTCALPISAAQGRAAQPADVGEMAGRSGASADLPRRRESVLADVFRRRHRQDPGELRRPGRFAGASGATEIGRASCRERVWSVEGGVYGKK